VSRGFLRRDGQRLQTLRHELRFEHQITRRIPGQRKLRREHQIGSGIQALAIRRQNALHIAGKIPDHRIDLGDADLHVPPKKTARHPSGNSKKPGRKTAAAFIKRHADAATGD